MTFQWTQQAMTGRLVRYADLNPSHPPSAEMRRPGPHEREEFLILGPGIPGRHTHLYEPHGFCIGGVRQGPDFVPAQYSLPTAEVFLVHSGEWRLFFGPNREDGSIDLSAGDVLSVPPNIFRGAAKLDEGKGFLWTARTQDEPKSIASPPAALPNSGWVIDTSSGHYQLRDLPQAAFANALDAAEQPAPAKATWQSLCAPASTMVANPLSPPAADGVQEAAVIAAQTTRDQITLGPAAGWWPHGFSLHRLTLASAAYVPLHARQEAQVLFIQQGTLEVSWDQGALIMGAGDSLSVPAGLAHAFRNTASVQAIVFAVRSSEDPATPIFASL